jgi:phage/plasmid-associated DNA primase
LKIIFPDDDIYKLYLTIIASSLDAVPLEKFCIANGDGRNGKGLLNELLLHMLGNYSYILSCAFLTGPIKQGSNPEIANINKKRVVIAREPDENSSLNIATVKELTGGSEMGARLNYSNETKIQLNLSFILECNKKPKINSVGHAEAMRILDIPFKAKGYNTQSDIDKLTDEEDIKRAFVINTKYKDYKYKHEFKQALFLILIEYHKDFLLNNRVLPYSIEVESRSHQYLKGCDELLNFVDEHFELTDEENYKNVNYNHITKLKRVYEVYKSSDFFNNLNKMQKRQNSYKNFIEKMQNNEFLKRHVKPNKGNTHVLLNYKEIEIEEENSNSFLD